MIDKELHAWVINLLENSVYFMNQVPNKKYRTRDFHDSYELASEIDSTLKKIKNDKRNNKNREGI